MSAKLLTNVTIWDGETDAPYPGEVLVDGNRIGAVARGAERIDRGRAAEVIDGQGMFLMPGMVEGHCHLTFLNVRDGTQLGDTPPEEHAFATARNATLLLNCGFTSCYSAASAKSRIDVVVRNEIENGYLAGPRLRAASPEITVTAGLGDAKLPHIVRESFAIVADGPDEIRKICRTQVRLGVDNLKINISGDEFTSFARAEITNMTDPEIAAAVDVAHTYGKQIASHSRAAESVKRAVRHGVDVIYHCEFADAEALDLLEGAKDRIFIGPAVGLLHNALFEGDKLGFTREQAEKIGLKRKFEKTCAVYHDMRQRGVRVVVGGDYGFAFTPQGTNARDIGHFVKFFGYSPAEAMRCATKVGGELMGYAGELGLVREGALADLLLVDGNPLADLSLLVGPDHFVMIMKDGQMHRDPRPRVVPQRMAAE